MRVPHLACAALTLLAAACVAEPADAIDPPDDADVVVIADDMFYDPDGIEVPAGEAVSLYLANEGGVVHDLVFDDGWESGEVRPGEGVLLELPALTASTVAWCSVPGHRDAGMELHIEIVNG